MKKLPIGEGPMVAIAIGVSFRKHSPIKLLETDTANLPGKTLAVQMEVADALVRDHANAVNVVLHEGDTITVSKHFSKPLRDLTFAVYRPIVDAIVDNVLFLACHARDHRPRRVIVRRRLDTMVTADEVEDKTTVLVLAQQINPRWAVAARRWKPVLIEKFLFPSERHSLIRHRKIPLRSISHERKGQSLKDYWPSIQHRDELTRSHGPDCVGPVCSNVSPWVLVTTGRAKKGVRG